MKLDTDVKLDFSDVLIRPKRSTMNSRSDVSLKRTHTFLHSKEEWTGIPIMAANMDTVGTPDMHLALSNFDMITSPARHFLRDNPKAFGAGYHLCMMGGINDIDVLRIHKNLYKFIGLDVANGYTIRFVDAVKELREKCPDKTIVAGNVVTADMTT